MLEELRLATTKRISRVLWHDQGKSGCPNVCSCIKGMSKRNPTINGADDSIVRPNCWLGNEHCRSSYDGQYSRFKLDHTLKLNRMSFGIM